MAAIIRFPAAAGRRKEAAGQPKGPAQILFFTGVRYERFEKIKKRKPVTTPKLPLAI